MASAMSDTQGVFPVAWLHQIPEWRARTPLLGSRVIHRSVPVLLQVQAWTETLDKTRGLCPKGLNSICRLSSGHSWALHQTGFELRHPKIAHDISGVLKVILFPFGITWKFTFKALLHGDPSHSLRLCCFWSSGIWTVAGKEGKGFNATVIVEQSRLKQPAFFIPFFFFLEAKEPSNSTHVHLEWKHKIYSLPSLTSRLCGVLKLQPGTRPDLNNSSSFQLVSKKSPNKT